MQNGLESLAAALTREEEEDLEILASAALGTNGDGSDLDGLIAVWNCRLDPFELEPELLLGIDGLWGNSGKVIDGWLADTEMSLERPIEVPSERFEDRPPLHSSERTGLSTSVLL